MLDPIGVTKCNCYSTDPCQSGCYSVWELCIAMAVKPGLAPTLLRVTWSLFARCLNYAHFTYRSFYISEGDKEKLFINEELFLVIDHFLDPRDLQVWFSGDTLRRELDAIHSRLVTTTNNNCVLRRNSDLRLILLLRIRQWRDVWDTITIQLKEK